MIAPGFPDHALTMKPPWYADLDGDSGSVDRVTFLEIIFTTCEPARRMSLEFELTSQFGFGGGHWSNDLRLYPYTRRRTPDTLQAPLLVEPETAAIVGSISYAGQGSAYAAGLGSIRVLS